MKRAKGENMEGKTDNVEQPVWRPPAQDDPEAVLAEMLTRLFGSSDEAAAAHDAETAEIIRAHAVYADALARRLDKLTQASVEGLPIGAGRDVVLTSITTAMLWSRMIATRLRAQLREYERRQKQRQKEAPVER